MIAGSNTILEIRNLSNTYEGESLIKDVSFSLGKGEILALLGPSGAGKTTLLRLIAGLEKADFGSILFNHKCIRHIPPHKRNFGMMFQEYALFPHKNVWQNVAFGLEMKKCRLPEKAKIIEKTLGMVGLAGFEQRKVDELSGGERQRVALARSLAPEPQLLLLDEPFGSLDRSLRERLTHEIREILTSLKVTAIFVTHDQNEAFTVADKVAILHEGRLQQLAPPEDLYRHPANTTVAKFLGFTNIVAGDLNAQGVLKTNIGDFKLSDVEKKPGKCNLLIRPDAARHDSKGYAYDDEFQLQGVIIGCNFVGNRFKIKVAAKNEELLFDFPLDPPPPNVGDTISLTLNPAALCILADTH